MLTIFSPFPPAPCEFAYLPCFRQDVNTSLKINAIIVPDDLQQNESLSFFDTKLPTTTCGSNSSE